METNEIQKISEEVNLVDLYKMQHEMKTNENYEDYMKYLSRYFQKEEGKQKKYNRAESDDEHFLYKLTNRKNEKREIYIEPSKYMNLFQYQYEAIQEINEILYEISYLIENRDNISEEERNYFEILKSNYAILKKHRDEIKTIQTTHTEQIDQLFDRKLAKIFELTVELQKRKEIFEKIDSYLTQLQKRMIAEELQKENPQKEKRLLKPLSEFQIKEFGKKFQIPNSEIEHWMNWIISSFQYMIIQKDLNQVDKMIRSGIKEYEENMKQFMYESPKIKKNKL
jgi:hypothetical protein